jgi:hypothetical protein
VVEPSTLSDGPVPSTPMLESTLVLAPRLRGTEQRACPLWPLGAQAYAADNARCSCPSPRDEEQSLGLDSLGERHPPGSPEELVSFQRPHSPFFGRNPETLHEAPYGAVAECRARYMLQEAASLADGGIRALFYVPSEKELGFLVRLAGSSGTASLGSSDPP